MKHIKRFSLFEDNNNNRIPSKKEVEDVLDQFNDHERSVIVDVLSNDENSTDEEMAEYFTKELNLEPDTIAEVLGIRGYYLSGQDLRDAVADLPKK